MCSNTYLSAFKCLSANKKGLWDIRLMIEAFYVANNYPYYNISDKGFKGKKRMTHHYKNQRRMSLIDLILSLTCIQHQIRE